MICSMCEQEVKSLPYTLIDDIPEHKTPDGQPHIQEICEECKDSIGGIEAFDRSEDIQKHPLRIEKK